MFFNSALLVAYGLRTSDGCGRALMLTLANALSIMMMPTAMAQADQEYGTVHVRDHVGPFVAGEPVTIGFSGALDEPPDSIAIYRVNLCCTSSQLRAVNASSDHWSYHGSGESGEGVVTVTPAEVGDYYVILVGGDDGTTERTDPSNRMQIRVQQGPYSVVHVNDHEGPFILGQPFTVGFTDAQDCTAGTRVCLYNDWIGIYPVYMGEAWLTGYYVNTEWVYHGTADVGVGSAVVPAASMAVDYIVILLGGPDGYTEISDPNNRLVITVCPAAGCPECWNGSAGVDFPFNAPGCCPSGSLGNDADTECYPCSNGTYAPLDAEECAICTVGRTDDDSNPGTECVDCVAGRYSSATEVVGSCPGSCPAGSYGAAASSASSGCEYCAVGQYDNVECEFRTGSLVGNRVASCQAGDELCVFEVTRWKTSLIEYEDMLQKCTQEIVDKAPFANAATVSQEGGTSSGDSFHICYAGVGIPQLLTTGLQSCLFNTDPGTPCIDCPAGKFFSSTTECLACPTLVGMYAPAGSSSINACQPCQIGWVDHDYDAGTPCIPCPSGSFSNVSGLMGDKCERCPLASISDPGSTIREACMPTVQAKWTVCEPCASEYVEIEFERYNMSSRSAAYYSFSGNTDDSTGNVHGDINGAILAADRFGAANEAYTFYGSNSVTIPSPFTAGDFSIAIWLSPSVVDDGTWHGFVGYTEQAIYTQYSQPLPRSPSMWVNYNGEGQGDGLHWTTTAQAAGHMESYAGTVTSWFEPNTYVHTVWTAQAGEVYTFYKNGVVAGVETNVPLQIDIHEMFRIGQVETFFSGTIDEVAFYAFALNASDVATMNPCTVCTPEDLCKLCPQGYQYDNVSNTYEDFDECSYIDGGCDPLMGFMMFDLWTIEPCTNSQGSYTCNACPDGFETVGSSCRLPVVQVNQSDISSVQPKSSLVINGPAAALVLGSDAQAAFLSVVQADIAAALEVDEPSEIVLDNVVRPGRRRLLRRSMQEGTVELKFDILFDSDDAPGLVVAMMSQLGDPDSPLMNGATIHQLLAGQVPGIVFVCPVGKVRPDGELSCRKCASPMVADADGVSCNDCPKNQGPTERGDACTCLDGYYDTTAGAFTCLDAEYSPTDMPNDGIVCQSCAELDCVSACHAGELSLRPGWTKLTYQSGESAILQCKATVACTGLAVETGANDTGGACNVGYGGTICGVCENDYTMNSDGSCTSCGETSWGLLIALGVVTVAVLLWKLKTLLPFLDIVQNMAELFAALQLKQISKISTVVLQIIGNIGVVLNVTFPAVFENFLTSFVNFFRFDLSAAFNVGCISRSGYFSGLASNVIMVLIVVLLVFALFQFDVWSIKNHVLEEDEIEEQKIMLQKIYDDFDKDNKGLSQEELLACVERIGVEATAAEVGTLFKNADTDDSGVLTFDQFYEAATHTQDDGSATHAGVDLAYIVQAERIVEARSAAMGRCFLLVFLRRCPASFLLCMSLHFYRLELPNMTTVPTVYPSLTNKIFEGFICRDIGPNDAVLQVDYAISCVDDGYAKVLVLCSVLVLVWPFGLPAFMFVSALSRLLQYSFLPSRFRYVPNATVGVQYLMWDAREAIQNEDKAALQEFDFMIGDYKKTHWYWEIAELGRKLVLSGVLGLVGRGTVAQSMCATFVAFFYFAMVFHQRPYKVEALNMIKIFSEVQIFGVLVICW